MSYTPKDATQIRIGNYTLLQTLGSGSFAKVKLAVHTQTQLKVALKILCREKIRQGEMTKRVRREIIYLKSLRHRHIIKLYQVITTPTDIIMVTEHSGKELFEYICDRGRMPERDGRRFFHQIISAVDYIHKRGIVHRDLKPENILLDEYNNVKIADFGLSNVMVDGNFLLTSCGSPNYAAPEVITGKLYVGPEVDIWSCGVILYVMLCSRLPFDDDFIPTLFKKILSASYSVPSYLSSNAKLFIASMLTVDPIKRITLSEMKDNAWFNVDVPEHLFPSSEAEMEERTVIEESIVREINESMGFSKDVILEALASSGDNQVKVAYQLISDHRHLMKQADMNPENIAQRFMLVPLQSPTPSGTPHDTSISGSRFNMEDRASATSSVKALSSSLLKTMESRPKRSRTRWHVGIRSKSHPFDIMLELYRAMANISELQWKTLSVFAVRCKYQPHADHSPIKFDLQLFQATEINFLVDFRYIPSENDSKKANVFGFLDICSKIITELAISG